MSSAYILAERKIIEDANKGIDTTGHLAEQGWSMEFESTPEDFARPSQKEEILAKAREVRKQINEAIENEQYEVLPHLNKVLTILEAQYKRL